ncbi:MAG: hypothetical protein RL522_2379 [Pseudomonadota bacterium]
MAPSEMPARRLKLFLSYGRDEYSAEAKALRDALRQRGHEVWFDEEQLGSGIDWELAIEKGIAWCDRVVLTMTPHSVRRPDGFCLNEIAKALERQKLIIPVLLVSVPDGAPTSICRIQYLDWRDAVPAAEKTDRFGQQMVRLCEAIEEDKLDFEGGQQRLLRHLQPLNYDGDILRHVARFQGRAKLFERIGDWLRTPGGAQRLWLTGSPGLGKSAIIATLAHRWSETGAMHFCVAGHQEKADPARAVLSIAYQLSQRFDLYRQRLGQLELEREVSKDARTLFDTLLVGPLASHFPVPDKACLVMIDGLDEATAPDGSNLLAELVATQWSRLPGWLRLMVASRPDAEVQVWLQGLETIELSGSDAEQQADVRAYLEQALASLLDSRDQTVREKVIEQILDRSSGAFHYVSLLLEDVREGRCDPDSPVDLPAGMHAFYRQSFTRRFPDRSRYQATYRPLIGLLLAAPEPVPIQILAAATQRSVMDVRQQLSDFGSLLAINPGERGWPDDWDTVRLAHASLREWLTGLDKASRLPVAGAYAVQPDVKGLAAEVLGQWKQGGSELEADLRVEELPRRNGFVTRVLWFLLEAAGDWQAMDDIALDLSLYWEHRSLQRALAPGEYAAAWSQRLQVAVEGNTAMPVHYVKSLIHLGELYLALGRIEEAASRFQEGRRVVDAAPPSKALEPDHLEDKGSIHLALGHVLELRGDLAGALRELQEFCGIALRLAKDEPGHVGRQRQLGTAYNRIGGIYEAMGDSPRAIKEFEQAQAIMERLLQMRPDRSHLVIDMAANCSRLGILLTPSDDRAAAMAYMRRARDLMQVAVAREPANTKARFALGNYTCLVGELLQAYEGDLDGALKAYQEARGILDALIAIDPDSVSSKRGKSNLCGLIGGIHLERRELPLALAEFDSARSALEDLLAAEMEMSLGLHLDFARILKKIGEVLELDGRLDEAIHQYRRCQAMFQVLVDRAPDSFEAQVFLGASHAWVGHVLKAQGNLEDALSEFQHYRAIFEDLAARNPQNPSIHQDLELARKLVALLGNLQADSNPH